jgi:hypothetical protein
MTFSETNNIYVIRVQNMYISQNLKISFYTVTILSHIKHVYEKVKITSLHIIETGTHEFNQRQNTRKSGCQKYLRVKYMLTTACSTRYYKF